MKLKVQVMTVAGAVETVTVDVPSLDVSVAVQKAVLALDLEMSDVREARLISV